MSRHALFSLLVLCTSVHAADTLRAPETFSLSIARQPLDGALQQLARQCGVQLIFFSRVTEGLSAPTIEGEYTLAAAMDRLLDGSGLTFDVIDPQTVEVRPLQAKPANRSRSRDARGVSQPRKSLNEAAGPLEEVVVVGLAEQLVATRIATPLREIPQTLSIVTREQMRQRNEFTLADVLEHAPGITTLRTSSLDQDFYARAYQIKSLHIDGGAAINPKLDANSLAGALYLGTPDLVEFDHVEILRGSDALFSGNANPGGTISLVRKRPQHAFALDLSAAAGSWDDLRGELDVTGPMTRDGALRGRAAAVYSRDGYFYDIDPHEKKKIFAALEYDLTDAATLTAGASYQWDRAANVGTGLPFHADGRDAQLPRESAVDFHWARYRSDLSGIYLQYRQQLAPGWALKFNASRWRTEAEYAIGGFPGQIDPVTNAFDQQPFADITVSPNVHTQSTADVTLTGTLDWFGWREEVAIGGDATRFESHSDTDAYLAFGEPLRDPREFDPHDYPDPRLAGPPDFGAAATSTTDQYGMFASVRIDFDGAWSITGGARVSGDSTDTQLTLRTTLIPGQLTVPISSGTDHVVTPYAGLMYALDRHYSLYASYADIYLSQSGLFQRSPGKLLGPVSGVNREVGVKGEWGNGALNGSLAWYWIDQSNLPERVSRTLHGPPGPECCYGGVSTKSNGVDVELSGEVLPGWNLGAGYTYNERESRPSRPLSTVTPRHLLKAWSNVRLPGVFSRWQLGGSVHAQSETRSCPTGAFQCRPIETVQPAYAVFDLRVGFDVDRRWRAALSLNNVLDKVYYESIDARAWYGEPRNVTLRIDGRY